MGVDDWRSGDDPHEYADMLGLADRQESSSEHESRPDSCAESCIESRVESCVESCAEPPASEAGCCEELEERCDCAIGERGRLEELVRSNWAQFHQSAGHWSDPLR